MPAARLDSPSGAATKGPQICEVICCGALRVGSSQRMIASGIWLLIRFVRDLTGKRGVAPRPADARREDGNDPIAPLAAPASSAVPRRNVKGLTVFPTTLWAPGREPLEPRVTVEQGLISIDMFSISYVFDPGSRLEDVIELLTSLKIERRQIPNELLACIDARTGGKFGR